VLHWQENCALAAEMTLKRVLLVGIALVVAGCNQSPEAKSLKHIEMGKELLRKNDPKRAVIEFRNALQATPKDPEVFYQLGLAYLASGDTQKGLAAIRKAIELDPKHSGARLRLAELMASTHNPDILKDAQQRLRALLQEDQNDPRALHALALTELKLGESGSAIEHLQEAFAAAPQELTVAVTLAAAELKVDNPKGAEKVLKQACANAPRSADAAVLLGRFYAAQKRPVEAAQQFEHALSLDPNAGAALLNLAMLQIDTGQKHAAELSLKRLSGFPDKAYKPAYATFLLQEGRYDEAIREFEKLAKLDPKDRTARTRLVMAYRASNRPAEAEQLLSRALKENPNDRDALLQRGELELASRQYGRAEVDLNQVLHIEPSSPEIHYVLARLHQARGENLTYQQELSKALELNPYLLPVRLELAQALTGNKGAQAALDLLDRTPPSQKLRTEVLVQRNWALWALENLKEMRKGIDSGLAQQRTPDLLIQDGIWKLRAGDSTGARTAIEEALKLDPTDIRAMKVLGQTYVAQKNAPMAMQKVKEYAAQQPRSAPVQSFLGTLLVAQGDRAGARAAFEAAKTADPNSDRGILSLTQLDILDGKVDSAQQRLQGLVAADDNNTLAHLWLGNVYATKRDYKAAEQQFRAVIGSDPNNPHALNNLAYLLADHDNQTTEALTYAQKAKELAPDKREYADTLGWIFYLRGLYSSAVSELERATAGHTDAVAEYHLAMAYAKAGEKERSQQVLQAVLKQNPMLPEAKLAQQVVSEASAKAGGSR
jgi:tetratricopeptide (TPR) repeat protein